MGGIKRVAGLAWNRLLMRVDNRTGKGASCMDEFSSKVHRVHMELGGKLLNSLRIKTPSLCCSFFELENTLSILN